MQGPLAFRSIGSAVHREIRPRETRIAEPDIVLVLLRNYYLLLCRVNTKELSLGFCISTDRRFPKPQTFRIKSSILSSDTLLVRNCVHEEIMLFSDVFNMLKTAMELKTYCINLINGWATSRAHTGPTLDAVKSCFMMIVWKKFSIVNHFGHGVF